MDKALENRLLYGTLLGLAAAGATYCSLAAEAALSSSSLPEAIFPNENRISTNPLPLEVPHIQTSSPERLAVKSELAGSHEVPPDLTLPSFVPLDSLINQKTYEISTIYSDVRPQETHQFVVGESEDRTFGALYHVDPRFATGHQHRFVCAAKELIDVQSMSFIGTGSQYLTTISSSQGLAVVHLFERRILELPQPACRFKGASGFEVMSLVDNKGWSIRTKGALEDINSAWVYFDRDMNVTGVLHRRGAWEAVYQK